MNYYYFSNGQEVEGPVSKDTLAQLVTKGRLDESAQVCPEGEEEWQPIRDAIGPEAGRVPESQSLVVIPPVKTKVQRMPSTLVACPTCGREISPQAAACPECGHPMKNAPVQQVIAPPAQQHVVVHAHPHPVQQHPKWNRGVAILLSLFFPGVGQMYKGQIFNGVLWMIFFVAVGYVFLIIPGIILHLCCLVGAASGDPYK